MSLSKRSKSSPARPSAKPSARRSSARPGTGSTRAVDRGALPLLRSIRALGLYRVAVVWKDGRKSEVDLAPQILRYAVYRPLRENPDAFARAKIVAGGVAVAWPGAGVDISADAIAALGRSQTMTPEEFRARLKRLGLSFDAAAATFAISRRQIAYYSAGAKPVPRHVVLALSGFEAELGGAI
ncbi:MAG: DUF2442 domain-containing protein [Rhodospirillales bacterium]|nr:DUF2442 domain-containing protein [Rhodospirillales bacterium]